MNLILRRASVLNPERVQVAIRARGFTLEGFAMEAGVSRKTLGDWLSGRRSCQIATELKIAGALRDLPVRIPADLAEPWPVPMPPQARELFGRLPHPTTGEESAPRRRGPSPQAYRAALLAVPALMAWQKHGYRMVPTGRAGADFRRHLAQAQPWLAFAEVFPDETAYRRAEALTLEPLWP